MAPNLTLQQQQAVAKAKARARASQAGVEPLGGASGEWDLSKFEALPKPAQTKPLANTINAPNPITTAVQQSQQKAGQDWVTNKAAADAARKERTLYNAASGMAFTGGEDGSMPQLNTDPGPLFSDLGKGVVTSPIRAERGVVSGVESILNFPSDVADFLNSANKPEYRSKPVPRVDFSGAKIPVPQELDSVSGMLGEGLAQFLVSRKMVGSMAPGGGLAPQLAKDAAATFVGFDGKTGRLADIIDSNAVPAGPMRDYLEFLKTQPDDSPLVGRFKNLLEDMTASSAMVAPLPVARAGLEAMKPKPGAVAAATPSPAPVRPAAPAAQPSPAPVTAIPQTPPRPAQGGPASPGQQPTAGPAPAAPGVTGGQGGGVLNAVPAAPVVSKGEVRVAKDTAKILSRIMRSSRINDADVRGYLPGAVQRYKGLNDPSVPFAFFLEGDLPQHFPQPIAEEVVTKLQTWGRERNAATGPQDTSRRTIQQTVKTLREGQQDYLSGVMDQNLYKGKLIGQEDKLKASLKANAQTAYDTALQNANNGLLSGRATVDQRNALGKIQELLHNDAFLKQVPQHLRIKAMREGIDLEDFVQKDPLAAAHWLQSELRQAVSAAEGVGGSATSESRLYGEMRQALLDQLETAVPGYKGARKAHGDIYGAVEALDFGNSFFKAARSEVETARLARQFKALSKRQQTAATMSIRDALKNEFRNKAEDTAAKVTRLQQAGVLEALETVLGADGKRVADGIRNIVKQNDRLKAIDQGSGSPTYSNQRGGEAAREMVQSPVNKAVGQFGDKTSWPVTIAGDIMLGTQGIPPLLTTSKVASAVVDRFGNPSPKMLSRATEGLYGLPAPPPANALSGPPSPRGGRPRVPAPPPTQQTLDDLLREYDAIDHRNEPAKAAQVLKKIDALKKRLAKNEANALSAPPSPPVKGPVNKAGFFGSGSKPLDMSEAGRMQRAREQGFTIEAYHGTRRDFDEFDVNEAGSNFSQDEGTIHFTDDAKDADAYAMSDTTGMPADGGSTYPVLLRMKKPLVADRAFFEREGMGNVYANEDRISAWDTYHPFLKERAEEMGADGIILKDSFGKSHYVVFDPKNVRSKFAKFDPSQSGSSKLLAGMGKGTGGRIASQVGPPAFAATVASVGPEGEPYEDKLKRMLLAAGATAGVRNIGALARVGKAGIGRINQNGIKAYHGSPHDFDKFELSDRTLGTGEGAQAYGHGLYFAENEGVAKSYRDILGADKNRKVIGRDGDLPSWVASDLESGRDPAILLNDFEGRLRQMEDGIASGSDNQPWVTQSQIVGIKKIIENIKAVASGEAKLAPKGRLYEVDIDADPEHFLDWDKPVTRKLDVTKAGDGKAAWYAGDELELMVDNDAKLYAQRDVLMPLIEKYRRDPQNPAIRAPIERAFRRASPDYGLKEIEQKHWPTLGDDYKRMEIEKGPKAAQQWAKDQGFKGIKFLDQGSRNAGDGTRNYVVFDDNAVKIVNKSGLKGAAPEVVGAGAGALLAPDANGDGTVDGMERFGGMVSGVIGTKLARAGLGKVSKKGPPNALRGVNRPSGIDQQTFGGINAKTADKKLLGIAQDMEKAGAGIREIGGGGPDINRYAFDAAKGYRVEVGVLGDGSVHFGTAPNHYASGVGGTQGAGQFTGAEAGKILRGVQETIALDAQKTGRARYVLEPQDQRMQSLVQKAKPPAGYTAKPTQWGVEFARDPSKLDMSEAGRGKTLLQQLARPNEPKRISELLAGSPVSVTPDEAKEMLDLIRMHLRPVDPNDYGRGFGFTLDELKADPSIAEEFLNYDPQKLAQFQAVLGTIGHPSQSGSSKLLAGMGGSEGAGAVGGGALGYATAPDQNGDGVIDANERALGAIGGAVSGGLIVKGAKLGVNALKGGAKAAERVPEQSGFFGGKGPPKPANDAKPLKGNQKAWLGREMSDEDATSLMLAKQSGMKDAELAKAMKISVEDVPLAIERAREVTTLINPKKARTLRQQGVADEEIARQIGWSVEETDPASLRSALDALERKAIKAEPPSQAGFFSGGKGPPKTPTVSLPKRIVEQLRTSKLSPELRSALEANAALPAAEQKSAFEVANSINAAPELYGMIAPYIAKGSELEARVGRELSKLVDEANADPANLALRRLSAEIAVKQAETDLVAAKKAQRTARTNYSNQVSRNALNPNAATLNQPFKETRNAAEAAVAEAEKRKLAAARALSERRMEVINFEQSKKWAQDQLAMITEAMGPNVSPSGALPVYNPMNRTNAKPPGARIGAPVSGPNGLAPPVSKTIAPPPVRAAVPKYAKASKYESEDAAKLVFDKQAAKTLADIQAGRVELKPYSNAHYLFSYLAQHPVQGAGVALAIAGSAGGYAAIISEADKANRDAMIKSGAMRDPNAPEPENPNAWNWEKQVTRPQFVETLQLNLQQLGYKIADDGRIYRKDGKETNTTKAIKHWQWKQGHEQTGILTEEEWYTLQEQAQEARRTQPANNRAYRPSPQPMTPEPASTVR